MTELNTRRTQRFLVSHLIESAQTLTLRCSCVIVHAWSLTLESPDRKLFQSVLIFQKQSSSLYRCRESTEMTSAGCPEKLQNRDKAEMGEATASLAAATEISVDSVVAAFYLFIYFFIRTGWNFCIYWRTKNNTKGFFFWRTKCFCSLLLTDFGKNFVLHCGTSLLEQSSDVGLMSPLAPNRSLMLLHLSIILNIRWKVCLITFQVFLD